jgi:hypothetical protein
MKEERLTPLMNRFAELLAEVRVFQHAQQENGSGR